MTEETKKPADAADARVVTPDHAPPEGASTTATWAPSDGEAFDYTAAAGWTVLRADEAPTAEIFSVSYVADGDEARSSSTCSPAPITTCSRGSTACPPWLRRRTTTVVPASTAIWRRSPRRP